MRKWIHLEIYKQVFLKLHSSPFLTDPALTWMEILLCPHCADPSKERLTLALKAVLGRTEKYEIYNSITTESRILTIVTKWELVRRPCGQFLADDIGQRTQYDHWTWMMRYERNKSRFEQNRLEWTKIQERSKYSKGCILLSSLSTFW